MKVSQKTWTDYVGNLRDLNDTATGKVRQYLETHEIQTNEDRNQLVSYAFAVSTKYGEGAAALSAKMFDSIAAAEGVSIPEAEIADTATMDETARAVVGTLKTGNNDIVAGSVGRLVKMAGVDTTMKNAIRYGAEWAWLPQGNETCAFCLMLASRGWQHASKDALKNGHAEHIHAHCDCIYAVRFDSSTDYEGYNPDKYLQMYEDAEGDTWQEKVNSMRRNISNNNKKTIRIQKKEKPLRSIASRDEGVNIIKKQ